MIKYAFFDLDGTIMCSDPGVIECVKYSIEKSGFPMPDIKTLFKFIGPPLRDSYIDFCSMTEEQSMRAIAYYRERYNAKGIFECEVYPGIIELFARLKSNGVIIATATSKPEHMAVRIADKFGLNEYLTLVAGSDDTETQTKTDVILNAFDRLSIGESDRDSVLMIGDRKFDVIGAHNCGIKCLGAVWGYGTREEFVSSGADYCADTAEEAGDIILSI